MQHTRCVLTYTHHSHAYSFIHSVSKNTVYTCTACETMNSLLTVLLTVKGQILNFQMYWDGCVVFCQMITNYISNNLD